ncbi:MAG TPA: hypothetical protein ENK54_04295 [Thiotrichales bacterium]|nr:hypothetical protein [Thiotrichales bacterium]
MTFDLLSVSALVISVVVLFVVFAAMRRQEEETEHKLRCLAAHSLLMSGNGKMRRIAIGIHEIYPELCPGVDYTLEATPEGEVRIKEWLVKAPQPSSEEIERAAERSSMA